MNPGNLNKITTIFFIIFSFSFSLQSKTIEGKIAKIQILDKITAEVKTFEINVDNSLKFESLDIQIYSCHKNPPDKIPEDYVLLKIFDEVNNENAQLIYQGWMISSSPAVTPLEHPIYDLWIKECKVK
tara:strand:+ start:347 stop:730 length:384 start_codon:yes stop_codon:yes gene_type:complete